jgi:photosystem II stability/assembly factor-like uncharacterized protein
VIPQRIDRVVISQRNPNVVYAIGSFGATQFAQLYVSVDRGRTWKSVLNGGSQQFNTSSLALSPSDPNVLLATTFDPARLFRSSDGGRTWVEASTPAGPAASFELQGLIFSGSGNAYVTINYGGSPKGGEEIVEDRLLRSRDNGATWTTVLSRSYATSRRGDFSWGPILANPADPAELIVATNLAFAYRTADGGSTFAELALPRSGLELQLVGSSPTGTQTLYARGGENGSLLWAYTLSTAPNELPRTGDLLPSVLSFAACLGAAFILLGLRLRAV